MVLPLAYSCHSACFCGSSTVVASPPVLAAGLCNSPCAGNPLIACGGDTEYLLYVNRAVDRPAYESYSATYLALPTPTYACATGGTQPPPLQPQPPN